MPELTELQEGSIRSHFHTTGQVIDEATGESITGLEGSVEKVLVKRTTNLSIGPSNDSVPDYDSIIEDTMVVPWWSLAEPSGFVVPAEYDGKDVIFTAKGAVADLNTSVYLEAKMYLFPAASGRDRPISESEDEDYLLTVEQHPGVDSTNHFIRASSDPYTVHTGDRIFVAWRTSNTQTLITYNGRVSITLGAYVLPARGPRGATGEQGAPGASGEGGVPQGTAFPGTASDRELFFRTDRDLLYFYDEANDQWLTVQQYRMESSLLGSTTTSGTIILRSTPHHTTPLWLEKMLVSTYVSTTNNGSQFWTLNARKYPASFAGIDAVLVASRSTSGDSAGQALTSEVAIGELFDPSVHKILHIEADKTSTPGAIHCAAAIVYRLVG